MLGEIISLVEAIPRFSNRRRIGLELYAKIINDQCEHEAAGHCYASTIHGSILVDLVAADSESDAAGGFLFWAMGGDD